MTRLDLTHDPAARSWVASANAADTDFPLQNLPLGRMVLPGYPDPVRRIAVAIGDQALDLAAAGLIDHADMARLMSATAAERQALRLALFEGLREGSPVQARWAEAQIGRAHV